MQEKSNPQQSTQRCFNCNRTRHFARDCRSSRKLNQMGYQIWQMNGRGASISVRKNFQNYQSNNIQNDQVSEDFAIINTLLIRKSHQQPINKTIATRKVKTTQQTLFKTLTTLKESAKQTAMG